jgi:MscS family membrane protein
MIFEEVSVLGSSLRQWIIAFLFLIVSFGLGKMVYWIVTKVVRQITSKTKTQLDDLIIDLIDRPIFFLIILGGIYLAVQQVSLPNNVDIAVSRIIFVLFLLNVSWVIINFIDAVIINYLKPMAEKTKNDIDDAFIPMVGKIVKVMLWLIVLIIIITNLGYDVSALLAGLGLGGLAFALAAQDLLSNLFGGFAILTDKPFKIGDRIKFSQNDGTVKEIGFRTTRIETFDGTQLIVPNAELAKTILENISKEPARRVVVKIGLEYDTSNKKLKLAEDILKDIVLKKKELQDKSVVGFSDFGDFSLIMTLIYWIKDPSKFMEVKSDVNMEIKERFEKAGLTFAFPTSHVIVSSQKKR